MALRTFHLEAHLARVKKKEATSAARLRQAETELTNNGDPALHKRLRARMSGARRAMATLFGERDDLEQRSFEATERQIDRFNVVNRTEGNPDPWDARYQLISDLPEEERQTAWAKMQSTFLRRIQECFCDEAHRILPHAPRRADAQDIEALLLTPECVSDDVAAKIGFVHFTESDSPIERWRKKHDPSAIERLRALLRDAKPLQEGNNRLIELSDGHILYSSNGTARDESVHNGNGKTLQVFDAYGALRKTQHEQQLYAKEIQVLEGVRLQLQQLQPRIAAWRADTPHAEKEAIESATLPVLQACAEILQNAINIYKRTAGNTLEGIEDFSVLRASDSRRIQNPSAIMAKLVKVQNRLAARFREMVPMGGHNEEDALVLRREISRAETIFLNLRKTLSGSTEENMENVARERMFLPLQQITLLPFCTYAQKLIELSRTELTPAVRDHDETACMDGLVKAHAIVTLQEVAHTFEHIKIQMLAQEYVGIPELKQCVDNLLGIFTSTNMFPGHRVNSYSELLNTMQAALAAIQRGLEHYRGQQMTQEKHKEMLARLRKYLDSFDIEAMVKDIP